MRKICLFIVAVVAFTGTVRADLLAGWNVGGLNGTNNNLAPVSLAVDMDSGNIARGAGLTAGTATNSFLSSSWSVGGSVGNAITSNDFFSVIITSDLGTTMSLTNLSWQVNRSGTGPTNFTLRSSIDSFASDIITWTRSGTAAGNVQTDLAISGVNTIEFRVYGYNAGGGGGTGRIADGGDIGSTGVDFGIFGTVVPEPATFLLMGTGLIALTASRRKIRPQA
jgi:PEP-CTERM motif